jgi:hypothetical protein
MSPTPLLSRHRCQLCHCHSFVISHCYHCHHCHCRLSALSSVTTVTTVATGTLNLRYFYGQLLTTVFDTLLHGELRKKIKFPHVGGTHVELAVRRFSHFCHERNSLDWPNFFRKKQLFTEKREKQSETGFRELEPIFFSNQRFIFKISAAFRVWVTFPVKNWVFFPIFRGRGFLQSRNVFGYLQKTLFETRFREISMRAFQIRS